MQPSLPILGGAPILVSIAWGMCAGSNMSDKNILFAPPTQPASAPRVRSFAELVLKEIRGEMGGDPRLLSDKQAFSEFMDKVNESVLLGHRKPPSAESITQAEEEISEEDEDEICYDLTGKDGGTGPTSPSLQSIDVKESVPRMAANLLHDSMSRFSCPSPLRHRRPDSRTVPAGATSSLPTTAPLSSVRSRRVHFHPDAGDDYSCTRPGKFSHGGHRQHEEKGPNAEEGGQSQKYLAECVEGAREKYPSNSGFDGATLLQDLRRWRCGAAELINRGAQPASLPARITPMCPMKTVPPLSLRSPSTSTIGIGIDEDSNVPGLPPPPLSPGGDEDKHTISGTRMARGCRAEVDMALASESIEAYAMPVRDVPGAHRIERDRLKDWGTADSERSGCSGKRGSQNGDPNVVRGSSRRSTQIWSKQPQSEDVVAKGPDGRQGWCSVSREAGRVAPMSRGEPLGSVRGRKGKGSEVDAVDLSLDLSDCSDEKLGELLDRGRRRGGGSSGGTARQRQQTRATPGG